MLSTLMDCFDSIRARRLNAGQQQAEHHCTRRATLLLTAGLALGAMATGAFATKSTPPKLTKPTTVLVMGDSLSAEYGLARGSGWVALTEARMAEQHWPVTVVNASLSGETTGGGLTRLPPLLSRHRPNVVVIELGANDALRGLPVKQARQQLGQMISLSQQAGARVLLVGMLAPPNLGKRYADEFAAMYADLARETKSGLVPFMLQGVADRPDARDWFQADGLHPLAKAHPIIRDTIWPAWQASLLGRQVR